MNTKLPKSCSESQKLLKVAKVGTSYSKRQKLHKSCRAQSVWAHNHGYRSFEYASSINSGLLVFLGKFLARGIFKGAQ